MLYEEWINTASPKETLDYNGDGEYNSYVLPYNILAMEYTVMPRHWGRSVYTFTFIDYTILDNEHNNNLLEKAGGELSNALYTDEGYGVPYFRHDSDSLALAFNFMRDFKDQLQTT